MTSSASRRTSAITVLGVAAALATAAVPAPVTAHASAGAAAIAAHHPHTVLGSKRYPTKDGEGFGTAHPREVYNGGDPSGDAFDLTWSHWGASTARAHGKTYVFKPSGGYYAKPGRIQFRADHVGHCTSSGPRAYRHLHARVAAPGHSYGHWFAWSGSKNICDPGFD